MGIEREEGFRENLLRRAGRLRVCGVPTVQLQEALWLQTGREVPVARMVPGEIDRPFLSLIPWAGGVCPGCLSGLSPRSRICHTCKRSQDHGGKNVGTYTWRIDHILQAVIPPGSKLFTPESLTPIREVGREVYSRLYPGVSPPRLWFPEEHDFQLDPRTPEWLRG